MSELIMNPSRHQWDGFISDCTGALFSHSFDWGEKIAQVYDLSVLRLMLRDGATGRVQAALPLILFNPPEMAARLVSLPYTDGAGMLAINDGAARCMLGNALDYAAGKGIPYLEIRQPGVDLDFSVFGEGPGRWHHSAYTFKTGLQRGLPDSADVLWAEQRSKVRNQVRKARREGCVARIGDIELVDDFYTVFSENMRDLGSPVHDYRLFSALLGCSSLQGRVLVVYLAGVPAATAIVFRRGNTLSNPWASSVKRYRWACPNMLLYWSMLVYSVSCGCSVFDFGRSTPGAPTCRFKEQWGAKPIPLTWHVFSRHGHIPWDPRMESLEVKNWKHMEMDQSRRMGPGVRRWISL